LLRCKAKYECGLGRRFDEGSQYFELAGQVVAMRQRCPTPFATGSDDQVAWKFLVRIREARRAAAAPVDATLIPSPQPAGFPETISVGGVPSGGVFWLAIKT